MKKILSVMFTTILIIGAATVAYAGTENTQSAGNTNYKDLKTTNWAYKYVNPLTQKGVVKGYTDGSFKPNNTVTYGEFIKLCLVAETREDIGNSKTGNWAKKYYNKALELGYFGSTDIKESQLNRQIPRCDMALIISNILGEMKIDNYSSLESNLKDIDSSVKNDYDIVKSYASGIITGYEDGSFKPNNTLTRAESSTVVYRLIDETARVLPKVTQYNVSMNDVDEVLTNTDTFINTGSGDYNEYLAKITSYKITKNASQFNMTLGKTTPADGSKGINYIKTNTNAGKIYFVRNDEIVEAGDCMPDMKDKGYNDILYKSDLSKIDYILILPYEAYESDVDSVEALLVVNPFK